MNYLNHKLAFLTILFSAVLAFGQTTEIFQSRINENGNYSEKVYMLTVKKDKKGNVTSVERTLTSNKKVKGISTFFEGEVDYEITKEGFTIPASKSGQYKFYEFKGKEGEVEPIFFSKDGHTVINIHCGCKASAGTISINATGDGQCNPARASGVFFSCNSIGCSGCCSQTVSIDQYTFDNGIWIAE